MATDTTALARRFRIDVSEDDVTYTQVKGVLSFKPEVASVLKDVSDYDTDGWGRSEKTMQRWTLAMKLRRRVDTGTFDPGQELLRAREAEFGADARIYVRWYDRDGGPEAFKGQGLVEWKRGADGVEDVEDNDVMITGDGARTAISNPFDEDAVPAISSMSDNTLVADGELVTIHGSGFASVTGPTGVTFGGTNAADYEVISDSVISATVPVLATGSRPVIVTNAEGASAAFPFTAV